MKKLFNRKGYMMALICAALPLFLAIAGLVIDCGIIMYYKARLMTAVKFAAISAVSNYDIDDYGAIVLKEEPDFVTEALQKNFQEAILTRFELDATEPNVCLIEAEVKVPLHFAGILGEVRGDEGSSFSADSNGRIKITLSESYLARRELLPDEGEA